MEATCDWKELKGDRKLDTASRSGFAVTGTEPLVSLPLAKPLIEPTLNSGHMCQACAAYLFLEALWFEKLPDHPPRTANVGGRICISRDPETRKRVYIGKSIRGGLRDARAHLNPMGAGLL